MMYKLLVTALTVCVFAGIYAFVPHSTEAIARSIVTECASGESQSCYEHVVPKLYPRLSVTQIFDVIREIRRIDPGYQMCHAVAHRIGELVVEQHPDTWFTQLSKGPSDGMCSNGYMHGVMVGRFDNFSLTEAELTKIIPDFRNACVARDDWSPTPLDRGICYHGLGHLYVITTKADLHASIKLCEATAKNESEDFFKICAEGVFMQIYQPLDPEDFELIRLLKNPPTKETYRAFCAQYADPVVEGACLREAWPFFRDAVLAGTAVETLCANQPNDTELTNCIGTLATITGRLLLDTPDRVITSCMAFPEELRHVCFRTSAQAVVEEDRAQGAKAIALCQRAGAYADQCLSHLAARAGFIFSQTPKRSQFCDEFPYEYRAACMLP